MKNMKTLFLFVSLFLYLVCAWSKIYLGDQRMAKKPLFYSYQKDSQCIFYSIRKYIKTQFKSKVKTSIWLTIVFLKYVKSNTIEHFLYRYKNKNKWSK